MTNPRPLQHLKSWTPFFEAFLNDSKKHDLRDITDRKFEVGEVVVLEEFDPFGCGYTGRKMNMMITYITDREHPCALSSVGLDRGMAILSFDRLTDAYT